MSLPRVLVDHATVRARVPELLRILAGPGAEPRPDQLEAVTAVAADGRRTLVVQRTGWGKSAVYFLATRLLRDAGAGPAFLISPLLALMRDQLAAAERVGVRARSINSTNVGEWRAVEAAVAADEVDLLLVSPERLANPRFAADVLPLLSRQAGLVVIDEAHCISDWGHDFRPDYRRIAKVLRGLGADVPVLGTTATANARVVADVAEQLGGDVLVLRGPLERASLVLSVVALPSAAERLAWLAQHLPELPGSGIVYCLTVADTRRVAAWLRANGVEAVAYSGKDDAGERAAIEDALKAGRCKAVVATSALGMGYDKPDLALVVHYQAPDSPVAYYQQVGRAGRAIPEAHAVLLGGPEDRRIWDYFTQTAFPPRRQVEQVLDLIAEAAPVRPSALQQRVNLGPNRLDAMLKVLDVEGAITRTEAGYEPGDPGWTYAAERYRRVTEARRAEQAAMLAYMAAESCLMAYLRDQLDDPEAAPCGRCQVCTGVGLSAEVAPELVEAAVAFLREQPVTVEPRRQWPPGAPVDKLTIPASLRLEPGRALGEATDAGWGPHLTKLLATGDPEDGLDDEVAAGVERLLAGWPEAAAAEWVTFVPSRARPALVAALAGVAAKALGIPLHPILERAPGRDGDRPQAELANSFHQYTNARGAFALAGRVPAGPVLLVDDVRASGWTLTTVGARLRHAGAGPVLPLVLLHGQPA